jgi:hypothetical protein
MINFLVAHLGDDLAKIVSNYDNDNPMERINVKDPMDRIKADMPKAPVTGGVNEFDEVFSFVLQIILDDKKAEEGKRCYSESEAEFVWEKAVARLEMQNGWKNQWPHATYCKYYL